MAIVRIDYTNYRGERRERRIVPIAIRFTANEWHPEPQWLMHAIDIEKAAAGEPAGRDFAMKGIHRWEQETGS